MKDYLPLNLPLMANPLNWIVVTLMVLLGGFMLSLLTSIGPEPKVSGNGE